MQQTADVEILWITVDVAAECLPVYGSFFSSAAVADGDAVAMAVDAAAEMTAACGSSFFSAAAADSEPDAEMAVDVEMAAVAAAMVDAAANYKDPFTFCQTKSGGANCIPASFTFYFHAFPSVFLPPLPASFSSSGIPHPLHKLHFHQ